mmetsp:Transcript_21771/g.41007  ORF Transcript_21771/g.41007 Transcript_21771/m.41007 type:complete len:285 (+) Transcript_21771:196-1050(+)
MWRGRMGAGLVPTLLAIFKIPAHKVQPEEDGLCQPKGTTSLADHRKPKVFLLQLLGIELRPHDDLRQLRSHRVAVLTSSVLGLQCLVRQVHHEPLPTQPLVVVFVLRQILGLHIRHGRTPGLNRLIRWREQCLGEDPNSWLQGPHRRSPPHVEALTSATGVAHFQLPLFSVCEGNALVRTGAAAPGKPHPAARLYTLHLHRERPFDDRPIDHQALHWRLHLVLDDPNDDVDQDDRHHKQREAAADLAWCSLWLHIVEAVQKVVGLVQDGFFLLGFVFHLLCHGN